MGKNQIIKKEKRRHRCYKSASTVTRAEWQTQGMGAMNLDDFNFATIVTKARL